MKIYRAQPTLAPPAEFGEGPCWHKGAVWYCDMPQKSVIRFDPEAETSEVFRYTTTVACLASTPDGLIAGTDDGFALIDRNGELRTTSALLANRPAHRMNDATVDPSGRFLSGSMSTPPLTNNPDGEIWCYGQAKAHLGGFITPNGMAVFADGRTLIISDSHPSVQKVWRFEYELETGQIGSRGEWLDFNSMSGRPDGAALDREGGYWIACIDAGEVRRFDALGQLSAVVAVANPKVTKPVFGGEDLRTMFITTAKVGGFGGELFSVQLPVAGLALPPVALDQLK